MPALLRLHPGADAMNIRSITPPSTPQLDVAAPLRALIRTLLTVTCLALVVVAVLAVRYVAFEYTHGDRSVVQRLLELPEAGKP